MGASATVGICAGTLTGVVGLRQLTGTFCWQTATVAPRRQQPVMIVDGVPPPPPPLPT
jgi:hypothetical protein